MFTQGRGLWHPHNHLSTRKCHICWVHPAHKPLLKPDLLGSACCWRGQCDSAVRITSELEFVSVRRSWLCGGVRVWITGQIRLRLFHTELVKRSLSVLIICSTASVSSSCRDKKALHLLWWRPHSVEPNIYNPLTPVASDACVEWIFVGFKWV